MTDDARLEFLPMDDLAVADWLPEAMGLYEQARIRAGDTAEQAAAGRRSSVERFFPDGRAADGQHLFTIDLDGRDAGWLWLGPSGADDDWWVWDIAVREPFRRRGFARAAMRFGERVARDHGAVTLGLNVFADNEAAIALYRSLGFEPSALHLRKAL